MGTLRYQVPYQNCIAFSKKFDKEIKSTNKEQIKTYKNCDELRYRRQEADGTGLIGTDTVNLYVGAKYQYQTYSSEEPTFAGANYYHQTRPDLVNLKLKSFCFDLKNDVSVHKVSAKGEKKKTFTWDSNKRKHFTGDSMMYTRQMAPLIS